MAIEPGVLDANGLAYSVNADCAQHEACRNLIQAAAEPSTTLYLTSQILCEFYSLITNPRRVSKAVPASEALRVLSSLLALRWLYRVCMCCPLRSAQWLDGWIC
jgi:predicted nucleic acid-binding protein